MDGLFESSWVLSKLSKRKDWTQSEKVVNEMAKIEDKAELPVHKVFIHDQETRH